MTGQSDGTDARSATWSARRTVIARIVEFLVFALLLVVDFELGARSLGSVTGSDFLVTALATALVAVVVAVLVLARRSMPLVLVVAAVLGVSFAASVVSGVTGSPSLSLTETAAVLLVTAFGVRESTPRGAVLVGAAALVVVVAGVLLRVGFDVTLVLLGVLVWGCAVTAGVAGRYVVTRREAAIEAARRAERMELARELHDVVAHQVSGIVVQAQAAIAVARTDPARAANALATIESAGAEAMTGMRRMVGAMREDADRDAPLTVQYGLTDIPPLVDRFDPGRQRTTLRLDHADAALPAGVGESAYRVVREALTNVRRHAPDANTRVSVVVVDSSLVIDVGNDRVRPRSVDPGSKGFGLTGMAERVAALGGTMKAGSDEEDTWRVRVSLPLEVSR